MKKTFIKEEILSNVNRFLAEGDNEDFEHSNYSKIIDTINTLDYHYYVLDSPLVDDMVYDKLFGLLKTIERKNPNMSLNKNSPTQRVGTNLIKGFITEEHLTPMLSLENSYNEADITEWAKKIIETKDIQVDFLTEPKFDGAGISLIYEHDRLAKALTRGNGVKGDIITQNAKQIYSIPLTAPFIEYGIKKIEIRGEVVLAKSKFKNINKTLEQENKPLLINPRNAASGSLRMKNSNIVRQRKLEAFLYHISHVEYIDEQKKILTHEQAIKILDELGFQTTLPFINICHSIADIISSYKSFEQQRETIDYEMDGLVVKVNNLHIQQSIGMTSHHPKWSVAYKFKAKQTKSKLREVQFQVGRTGIISPVAKIAPVVVGGATISSVSLFNEKYIVEKDLHINDNILIERSGDVIPYIVKNFPSERNGKEQKITFPSLCPCCETPLIKADLEAWVCPNNQNCEEQVIGSIIHFSARNAMDIRTLGEANIRKFYSLGFLRSIADIYQLPFGEIEQLEGFGAKSVDNLKMAIENSKKQSAEKLLFGLGIPQVGEVMAKQLCKRYKNIANLGQVAFEEFQQIEDVGEIVAKSLFVFFRDEENIKLLNFLSAKGVNMEYQSNVSLDENAFLSGKSFLFTGTLAERKRQEAEKIVKSFGGTISSGVNKKLSYLIVGKDGGSKLEKAKKIKTITILNENDFNTIITEQTLDLNK